MKIELKLRLTDDATTLLPDLPTWQYATYLGQTAFKTIHLDTPSLALRQQGIAVYVCVQNQSHRLRVSYDGTDMAGLSSTIELEYPLPDSRPNYYLIADAYLRGMILPLANGGMLHPMMVMQFNRQRWLLEREGTSIEVGFDKGDMRAGHQTDTICELRLARVAGAPAGIYTLAQEFLHRLPHTTIEHRSKSTRGLALLADL